MVVDTRCGMTLAPPAQVPKLLNGVLDRPATRPQGRGRAASRTREREREATPGAVRSQSAHIGQAAWDGAPRGVRRQSPTSPKCGIMAIPMVRHLVAKRFPIPSSLRPMGGRCGGRQARAATTSQGIEPRSSMLQCAVLAGIAPSWPFGPCGNNAGDPLRHPLSASRRRSQPQGGRPTCGESAANALVSSLRVISEYAPRARESGISDHRKRSTQMLAERGRRRTHAEPMERASERVLRPRLQEGSRRSPPEVSAGRPRRDLCGGSPGGSAK